MDNLTGSDYVKLHYPGSRTNTSIIGQNQVRIPDTGYDTSKKEAITQDIESKYNPHKVFVDFVAPQKLNPPEALAQAPDPTSIEGRSLVINEKDKSTWDFRQLCIGFFEADDGPEAIEWAAKHISTEGHSDDGIAGHSIMQLIVEALSPSEELKDSQENPSRKIPEPVMDVLNYGDLDTPLEKEEVALIFKDVLLLQFAKALVKEKVNTPPAPTATAQKKTQDYSLIIIFFALMINLALKWGAED